MPQRKIHRGRSNSHHTHATVFLFKYSLHTEIRRSWVYTVNESGRVSKSTDTTWNKMEHVSHKAVAFVLRSSQPHFLLLTMPCYPPPQRHWGTLCSAFCCGLFCLLWSPYKWGQTISSVPLLASNEGQYSLYSYVLLCVSVLFNSLYPWYKIRNHLFIFIICLLVNFWFSPVVA